MTLDILPEEARDEILSYFDSNELQLLRGVCHAWKDVIESTNQIGVVIHNDNYIWTLQSSNVFIARIRNFTKEFGEAIAFTRSIRRIEFHKIIVSYNLIRLLAKCTHLEKLKFSLITTDCHGRIRCPDGLILPQVKTLQFVMNGGFLLNRDEYILVDFLQQIVFGKLENLILRPGPVNSFEYIFPLISKQAVFDLPETIKSTSLVGFMVKNSQSLKRLTVNGDLRPFGLTIEDHAKDLGRLQLEEIVYQFNSTFMPQGNDGLLIEGQTKLKRIDVIFEFSIWPAVIRAITSSAVTLTYIKIIFSIGETEMLNVLSRNLSYFDSQLIDLSNLTGCINLRTFEMNTFLIPTTSMASLPDSIETLVLTGFYLKADILAIPTKLSKLKHFYLRDNTAPFRGDTEFDLELFQAFIRISTLTYLQVFSSHIEHEEILNYCVARPGIQAGFPSVSMFQGIGFQGKLTCHIEDNFDRSQI